MHKAVFLDRDGVINDGTRYYTYKPGDFIINDGVIEGLRLLQDSGFMLIVVTNQSGVAKGIYSREDVEETHLYMREVLKQHGIDIQAVYYCPHHPDIAPCECRKPATGMIDQAVSTWNIDVAQSFLIGDSIRDVEAAIKSGIHPVKILKNENIVPWCIKISRNEI
jgi:D-glycero-D-manno-heptose 1,7-bisphosphate phosphatase